MASLLRLSNSEANRRASSLRPLFHHIVLGGMRLLVSLNQRPGPAGAGARTLVSDSRWVGRLPVTLELLNASLRTGLSPRELLQMAESSRPTPQLDRWAKALRGQLPAGSLRGITEALAVSYGRLTAAAQRAARL